MVCPIKTFSKIVASLSQLPRPKKKKKKKKPKIQIFLLCALKKSLEMWFETLLMLKVSQLTLEISFWKYILSFETWQLFLGFCLFAYSNKEKRRAKKAQKISKNEQELIFITVNQEQMNKIRSPINIRAFTK